MFDRDFDGFMSDLGRIIQKYEMAKATGDSIYLEVSECEELFDHYFSTGDFEILGSNFDPIKSLGLRSGVRFRF